MEDASDSELVSRMNAGEEAAFAHLYRRHREWAFRMACRITGCQHMAQDVLQEVFRYFLEKFPGFELHCDLRTFLYPAIRNLSLRALQGTRRFVGGESGEATLSQLAAPTDHTAGSSDLHQIIARLSSDHREILLLRYVDGMTLPEIATLTGIPLGTAKSRLHHALASLRSDPKIQRMEISLNDSPSHRA